MADLKSIRTSALPLAFKCPAAVRPSIVPLNEVHEAATMGTAAHHAARRLAETGSIDWDALPAIAARFEVDGEELRMLCAMATKLWREVSASFHGALTEVELVSEPVPGVTLTGHADLFAVASNAIRVGDWKFGRKDSDYSQQLRGYAALGLLHGPEIEEATGTVLWVRDCEVENYTMRRPELEAWLEEFRSTVVEWDGVYRPGKQCTFCPRSHECPAANALIRRDVAAMNDRELVARAESELDLMAPAEIIELHRKADTVRRYCERVREAIKAHVEKHGEIAANGSVLTIDTQQRRSLDPLRAFPVLESAGFGDEDFARVMDLRISKVEKVVAEKAGKGGGASAKRELDAALRKVGAIEVTETKQLQEKRQ